MPTLLAQASHQRVDNLSMSPTSDHLTETPFLEPPGMVSREDVRRMFGIGYRTIKRWEQAGLIPRGKRPVGHWKLYDKAEIERLVEQYGALAPPCPDPLHPGCYRLPLTEFDIRRHETIIDAESLPLVQGKNF